MGFGLTLITACSVPNGQQLEIILGDDWTLAHGMFYLYIDQNHYKCCWTNLKNITWT
jgi:hypothetical protein